MIGPERIAELRKLAENIRNGNWTSVDSKDLFDAIEYFDNLLAERKQLVAIVRAWKSGIHHNECDACYLTEQAIEAWRAGAESDVHSGGGDE